MSASPSLDELLSTVAAAQVSDLHVAMPGIVTAYDRAKNRCSVQPALLRAHIDEEGVRQTEQYPVVTNVPVAMFGGGGFKMTVPLEKGDTVLLIFASGSLDRWLVKGGIVDPEDERTHTLTDAVAIPGLLSFPDASDETADDAMVLSGAKFQVGSNGAADPVARRSDLQTIVTQLLSHVHTGVTTGSGSSGTAAGFTTPTCSPKVFLD